MSFVFPPTDTQPFDFRAALADTFPKDYVTSLNLARTRVERTLLAQPNSVALLEAIEGYLPYLRCLTTLLEKQDMDGRIRAFKFSWRSVLSKGVVTGIFTEKIEKPVVACRSLWYEFHYVLLAYAFCMVNMANRAVGAWDTQSCVPIVPLLLSGDASPASPAIGLAASDIGDAGRLLQRAAGVFATLATTISPRWRTPPVERPPECNPAVLLAMSRLMLADSDRLAALAALRRGMSAGVIDRLLVSVVSVYGEVSRVVQGEGLSAHDREELSEPFSDYVRRGRQLTEAALWRRLAAQNDAAERHGVAVACYQQALECLAQASATNASFVPYESVPAAAVQRTLQDTKANTVRINNNVTYQEVPAASVLRPGGGVVPVAQSVAEVRAYELPDAIEPQTLEPPTSQ